MCTFENEQSVAVCDLAIGKVREAVNAAFGDAVQYTPRAFPNSQKALQWIPKHARIE